MNYEFKNIILNGEKEERTIYGNIKFEKFNENECIATLKCPSSILQSESALLGVEINGEMHKFNILKDDLFGYKFSIPNINLATEKISCVLLEKINNNFEILLMGSTFTTDNTKLFQFLNVEKYVESLEDSNSQNEVIKTNLKTYNEEEKLIPESSSEDENTEENISQQEQEEFNLFEESNSNLNFYSKVENQIDAILNNFPLEDSLTEILPNSKFVKVVNEDETNHIFGVIYDDKNESPKYIVYGIPAKYGDNIPDTLSNNASWLPLDVDFPKEYGYYLMYQDAVSGKLIK